ncbi:hypothetical protein SLEP1_g20772 [Rubroshorea leprosula]|uniref:Protein WVD2-like 7 n=3 Tax=Rubroshorea leprosula TaxID=152421 RepID=A0AAV5JCI8_9ROSI|nr:hypothetical protein SLEP1_g20772 [Rubroshorea leprosula]
MATEADTHPSFCNQSWYCQDLSSDHQNYEGESTILDHGSVSFGRYAGELAWEKWSVFTHNRCQEELEKFKAPGFVAQKKAYFEEYYKKIRAMKELQAQQQDIDQLGPSQEIPGSSVSIEYGATDTAFLSKEDEEKNVSENQKLECGKTCDLNSSRGCISNNSQQVVKETQSHSSESNNANFVDGACVSLKLPHEKASCHHASSVGKRLRTVQQNGLIPGQVGQDINKMGKHEPLLKDKGTLTPATNKTKLGRTTEDAVKKFGKPKPSPQIGNSSQVVKGLPSREGITQTLASNINRQTTGARSTLHASSAHGKLVSSTSSVGDVKGKTASNSHCSRDNLKTRLPVVSRSTKFQGISKEVTVTGSLKNMTLNISRLKITRSKDLPDQGKCKSNQSIGVLGHNNLDKEGKGQKGKDNNDARIKREPKILTRSHKAPIPKMDHKISPWQSTDLKHAQRKQRYDISISLMVELYNTTH